MNKIVAAQKLLAFVPLSSARFASNIAPTESASSKLPRRIYNFPMDEKLMQRWKVQKPTDPISDGMALSLWGVNSRRPVRFFIVFVLFLCSGAWLPFAMVDYNIRKANKSK